MRISLHRRPTQALPAPMPGAGGADHPDRASDSYEDLVHESAIIAYVVLERPGGATFGELAEAVGIDEEAVVAAVRRLVPRKALRVRGSTVLPYFPFLEAN